MSSNSFYVNSTTITKGNFKSLVTNFVFQSNIYVRKVRSIFLCLVLLWVQTDFGPTKLFWLITNHLGRVQLSDTNSFWTGPNHYKNSPQKCNWNMTMDLSKTNWTRPKRFVPVHTTELAYQM